MAQSHNSLREHANILESALAKREADLVQLNLQVICLHLINIGIITYIQKSRKGFLREKFLPEPCVDITPFLQVQAVLKRKEEEDQQMKQVVQTLQLALEKEKTKVNDLKEQVRALCHTPESFDCR